MKIYDSFLFFNELELLEIRLNELYEVVDNFIIVECTKTHQNKNKPLYYYDNKDRFSKFSDKIVHYVFNPTSYPYGWYIENEQRNQIKNANFTMTEGDILLLSDADKILKAEAIKFIRDNPSYFNQPATSIMQMSYGYINTVIVEPRDCKGWRGTVIVPYSVYNSFSLNDIRLQKDSLPRLENAGWHFSFIGGVERVKQKLESYAHSELNNSYYVDNKRIEDRINNLKDPLDRPGFKLEIETDLSKFPKSSLAFKNLFLTNT